MNAMDTEILRSPRQRAETLLSPRQREIFALLGRGLTVKEIATRLGISDKTAENHIVAIRGRLGVPSTWSLLVLAVQMCVRDEIVGD